MISIFDDDGNRLSMTWNGLEFNAPTLGRMEAADGMRVDHVGFSTPTNFHSEAINDIVKNGGGLELYNPLVGTRVLNLRGSIRAVAESSLMKQIVDMQRAFHPLYLQSVLGTDFNGAQSWPPPAGLPAWVRTTPLKFTRVLPKTVDPAANPDGLFSLQYHVFPLELPDPAKSDVQQGLGADFEAQFLLADGGRSFSQSGSTQFNDGDIAWTWGQAPVWPIINITMSGAGSATLTLTTTQGPMATALVLDTSALGATDRLEIDTRTRTIFLNGVYDMSSYVSGDFPVFRGDGDTTVAWTNTTNVLTKSMSYRQSDYI